MKRYRSEPGVGKSRLFWEFTHSHRTEGCLIVEAGSVSYGKATSYLPVIELLRAYFQIESHDDQRKIREKVTGKLLSLDRVLEPWVPAFLALLDVPVDDDEWTRLDPSQRRQRTLDGVKRLVLREAQIQPLIVVFEDLHWIDGETQALLDGLVESVPTAKIVLLVNYRPEYAHAWSAKTYYRLLRIDPLPVESAKELLEVLLGAREDFSPLRRLLIERTEGNLFFLEESVRALVETGALLGDRGSYRLMNPLQTLQVPPTAQAILAARIDRLAEGIPFCPARNDRPSVSWSVGRSQELESPPRESDVVLAKDSFSIGCSAGPGHRAVARTPPEGSRRVSQTATVPACLRAESTRSASGAWLFRGYPCVYSRYGPATCSPSF